MNLISLLYDIPSRFYHQMKQVIFAETRSFWRQNRLFLLRQKFRRLYIKIYSSASTDRRVAFCYFLEFSFQCGSNQFNPISLWHSVQVLPTDEHRPCLFERELNSIRIPLSASSFLCPIFNKLIRYYFKKIATLLLLYKNWVLCVCKSIREQFSYPSNSPFQPEDIHWKPEDIQWIWDKR